MYKLSLADADVLRYLERPRPSSFGTHTQPSEVGRALLEIRDKHLHREISENFYDYCLIRFGILPESVDRFLAVAQDTPMPVPQANKQPKQSNVYFVSSGELVKIGYTVDLALRVATLANMSSMPITLLGYLPGDKNKERELHLRFAPYRKHGEWFLASEEVLAFARENLHHDD